MQRSFSILCGRIYFGILLSAILPVILLFGCGGSNSYDERAGVFSDSPVQGLTYVTAARQGVTGADGSFVYVHGERITFYAGQIVVGSTTGKERITPLDLASGAKGTSDSRVVNLCRFLQTLDDDNDPSNGIVILPAAGALLTWNSAWGANDGSIFNDAGSVYVSTGPFAQMMTALLTSLNNAGIFTVSTPRTLKTATAARKHFNTQIPVATFQPYVDTAGIGVSDLAASTSFYNGVMGLNIVSAGVDAGDRVETKLKDYRPTGNNVVLMHYDDPAISYANHPVKLVFAVPNAQTIYDAIIAAGGAGFSAPVLVESMGYKIGMALDPDGYLLELIEVTYLSSPILVGVGIGVNSLQASDDVYTRVLGRKFDYFLYVQNFMNEIVTISPHTPKKGLDVVLMNYFASKTYTNLPVKLVFTVDDPTAFAQAIAAEGLTVQQMPSAGVMGIAKDLNGYELQIVAP